MIENTNENTMRIKIDHSINIVLRKYRWETECHVKIIYKY